MLITKKNIVMALAILTACLVRAQMVYVVQITDMAKNDVYQVMTREEVSELKGKIAAEARAFPGVLAELRKEWNENELTKGSYFPAAKLAPRKMREQGPFAREQAEKRVEKANERIDDANYKAAKTAAGRGRARNLDAQAKANKDAQREAAAANLHDMLCNKLKEKVGHDIPKNGADFLQ